MNLWHLMSPTEAKPYWVISTSSVNCPFDCDIINGLWRCGEPCCGVPQSTRCRQTKQRVKSVWNFACLCVDTLYAYLHNWNQTRHFCPMLMDADLPQIRQINSEKLFLKMTYIVSRGEKAFVNDPMNGLTTALCVPGLLDLELPVFDGLLWTHGQVCRQF